MLSDICMMDCSTSYLRCCKGKGQQVSESEARCSRKRGQSPKRCVTSCPKPQSSSDPCPRTQKRASWYRAWERKRAWWAFTAIKGRACQIKTLISIFRLKMSAAWVSFCFLSVKQHNGTLLTCQMHFLCHISVSII